MRFLIPISYLGLRFILTNTTLSNDPSPLPTRTAWFHLGMTDTEKTLTAEAPRKSPLYHAWVNSVDNDSVLTHAGDTAGVITSSAQTLSPPYWTKVGMSKSSGVFVLRQEYPGRTAHLEITNVFGKTILSEIWRAKTLRVDLSTQPKGVYFLKLSWSETFQEILRVAVE